MSWFKIFKTEVLQGKIYYFGTFLVVLLLGFILGVSDQSRQKVMALITPTQWGADMVILPKAVSLEQFHADLLAGESRSLLPMALFDSTRDLVKGAFKMSAILSVKESGQEKVLQTGDDIGLQWMKGIRRIEPWHEQKIYSTPEWGNRVISGFFASGEKSILTQLKNLIDRKSVAQAIWIDDEQARQIGIQNQLETALAFFTFSILLIALIGLSIIAKLISQNLKSCFTVLSELGFSNFIKYKIIAMVFTTVIFIPLITGWIISHEIFIF